VKFEATVDEIRALLELAEADQGERRAASPRRQAASRRVPPPLLERYELLLEVGRCPAVAAIQRRICSGCHVRLPTMVEQRARRAPAIHTCPHCRRLLYVPELVQEQAPAEDGKAAAELRGHSGGRS
jgi:predicted  nucleic acid-binding Zn-ribbon protein